MQVIGSSVKWAASSSNRNGALFEAGASACRSSSRGRSTSRALPTVVLAPRERVPRGRGALSKGLEQADLGIEQRRPVGLGELLHLLGGICPAVQVVGRRGGGGEGGWA